VSKIARPDLKAIVTTADLWRREMAELEIQKQISITSLAGTVDLRRQAATIRRARRLDQMVLLFGQELEIEDHA
jgi:hypothetical protein